MVRNIEKTVDAGRRVIEKKGSAFDITIHEATAFCERLGSEHPAAVIFDVFLFGLAIGYRAGKREGRRPL